MKQPRRRLEGGQVLAGVVLLTLILMIIVPAMVRWVQIDSRMSVKDRKSTIAFNLAQAGIDRAYWKLKGSTTTWANARNGIALSGYNFDQAYSDVEGGAYRISISSGPASQTVTVIAEGRDTMNREKRAIKTVYTNLTIPGAIISGAGISEGGSSIVHWGPMLAMSNITLTGSAATNHFPRKLSKQVVLPFDVNGLTPPNTDNLEWWSGYNVPELPVFDFAALRSSAAATNTLNCSGTVTGTHVNHVTCGSACTNCTVQNLYKDLYYNSGYVWYWDNNVSWTGSNGVKGTVIVRGNLSIAGTDNFVPAAMNVPSSAWQEYQKFDTSAVNQYPGDTGLRSTAATYVLGSCGSTCEGSASGGDVGIEGFAYVGGTISMTGDSDVHGALWVEQGWSGAGNVMIFYDDSLSLPQLNVTLARTSWQEVSAQNANW
jgi:Tfp pilus assembly protein PilX